MGVSPDRIYIDKRLTGSNHQRPDLDQAQAAAPGQDSIPPQFKIISYRPSSTDVHVGRGGHPHPVQEISSLRKLQLRERQATITIGSSSLSFCQVYISVRPAFGFIRHSFFAGLRRVNKERTSCTPSFINALNRWL